MPRGKNSQTGVEYDQYKHGNYSMYNISEVTAGL